MKRKKLIKKPKKFKGVKPEGKNKIRKIRNMISKLEIKYARIDKQITKLEKRMFKEDDHTKTYPKLQSLQSEQKDVNHQIDKLLDELPPEERKKVIQEHFAASRVMVERELGGKLTEAEKWARAHLKKPATTTKSKNEMLKQGGASVYRLPAKRTWRRQSRSTPGKYYTVRLNQDDSLSCNCPGWIFSKYPKGCRHTRETHEKHGVG